MHAEQPPARGSPQSLTRSPAYTRSQTKPTYERGEGLGVTKVQTKKRLANSPLLNAFFREIGFQRPNKPSDPKGGLCTFYKYNIDFLTRKQVQYLFANTQTSAKIIAQSAKQVA